MWNPNAICDGVRAEERAAWIAQNQCLNPDQARNRIMNQFPQNFEGCGGIQSPNGCWNPNAICGGERAGDRATWLQQNQGLTEMVAIQHVMREFPSHFDGSGGGMMDGGMMGPAAMGNGIWDPNAMCDGTRAVERAIWLMNNQGLNEKVAQQQVMREFPSSFINGGMSGGMMGGGMMGGGMGGGMMGSGCGMWNPNAMCDGRRAEERSEWLQREQGLAPMVAQQRVMREFPAQFGAGMMGGGMGGGMMGGGMGGGMMGGGMMGGGMGGGMMGGGMMGGGMGGGMMGSGCGMWNPNAMCDGKRAEERSEWLQREQGLAPMVAQQRVMREYPAQFGAGMMGGGMGGGMMGGGMNSGGMMGGGMMSGGMMGGGMGGGMMGGGMMGSGCGGMMGGGMWNPNANCGGKRAEERALWLQQNQGVTLMVAQQQVMREFPSQFGMR